MNPEFSSIARAFASTSLRYRSLLPRFITFSRANTPSALLEFGGLHRPTSRSFIVYFFISFRVFLSGQPELEQTTLLRAVDRGGFMGCFENVAIAELCKGENASRFRRKSFPGHVASGHVVLSDADIGFSEIA